MYSITLKEGREKLPQKHHPWIFSGAIDKIMPSYTKADWAEVYSCDGRFIAYGYYDERSHIVLHLISWKRNDSPGDELIRNLVRQSVLRRRYLLSLNDTTALRLIHGDADFLPGIAADCYGKEIRIIISSRFADAFLPVIAAELDSMLHPSVIESTVDKAYASSEGLSEKTRHFREGKETKESDERPNVLFVENGIYYEAAPGKGQKSGFYADQRDNRQITELYAKGKTVLDLFSYTGGFTLHALRGGALFVNSVDSSESALRHLLYQIHLNENKGVLPPSSRDKVETHQANAFEFLRNAEKDKYDMMILDPPKLAKTKSGLEQAVKAYKDLNRVAMEKIKDGGIIATFSCSGAMTRENFQTIIAWAAADAGVEVQILRTLSAGEDHPVRVSFPESEYLKGFILRIWK